MKPAARPAAWPAARPAAWPPARARGLVPGGLALLASLALLGGCAQTGAERPALQIDSQTYRAQGQDSRVQFLILHYTDEDMARSARILTEQAVSAHYLLSDENPPRVYRLVDENRRAWHAGASHWAGSSNLNSASIGIEIVNAGAEKNADGSQRFTPYPEAQMDLMLALVRDIVARHQIKPERVLGHSDIAPQRKIDPGPLFPWWRLAEAGLIAWPDAARVAAVQPVFEARLPGVAWFQEALARHGFQVDRHGLLDEPTRRVIAAFQMKYRPARHDGQPDAETAARLQVLTGLAPPPAAAPAANGTAPATP
ncbi:N-acetylmuramoyl-L-alanine amidase [Aquabacterium sp. OR-4]|uniref:N-acetylmuramoyl-L-alanine amidase n=1 Tax=Aquabacterium sp. OR-4 TaxID=2978127 RepID=UPI0021B4A875|nr:N-acetylmuramoyl-L-alanine amidase [Aquabacterium sp. OR-4]MDT7838071.1 N-acetylmuramoyl-L-alanine amidase [Aquabacterium sp. OR-4]